MEFGVCGIRNRRLIWGEFGARNEKSYFRGSTNVAYGDLTCTERD